MNATQKLFGAAVIVCGLSMTVAVATQQPATQPARSDPPFAAPSPSPAPASGRNYVGSLACRRCHMPTYERWTKTRMANVVLDPKTHRDAVLGNFAAPNPAVTFKLDDVALIYGSKWKQRYFRKEGNDYFPLGAQWDVKHNQWRPYLVQPNTDWWVSHYPATNEGRPTGPLCDGCHSVNFNPQTRTPTEWNVGCERCHGPGSEHIRQPNANNIVNPAKLDFVRANDTCIQCHSQGQPLTNPILGQYYDWPVGFHQGASLRDYWRLEEHKIGETNFMFYADGTAHKNRMQGNDFVQSVMYRRGVTCFSCHDVHGTDNNADLIKPTKNLCLTCHGASSPNGPHNVTTLEQHTHHQKGSTGSECIACHMPQIAQTIADINVRSHTFAFITPSMTETFKVANPCTGCHTNRDVAWAQKELRGWSNMSPWRVE